MVLRSSGKEHALRTMHERHKGVAREIEGDEPFALIHDSTPTCSIRPTDLPPVGGRDGCTMLAHISARHIEDGVHEVDARRRVGNYAIESDRFTHAVLGRNYDELVVLGGVDLAGDAIDIEATRNAAIDRLGSSDPGELTAAAMDIIACEAAVRLQNPDLSNSQRVIANEWIDARRKFELHDFLGHGVNRSRNRKQGGCKDDMVRDNRSVADQMLSLNWRRTSPVLAWSRAGASEWTDAFLATCGNVMVAPCTVPTDHYTVLRNSRDSEGFWNSNVMLPQTIDCRNATRVIVEGDLPPIGTEASEILDTMLRKTIHMSASAALRVSGANPCTMIIRKFDAFTRAIFGLLVAVVKPLLTTLPIPDEIPEGVKKMQEQLQQFLKQMRLVYYKL